MCVKCKQKHRVMFLDIPSCFNTVTLDVVQDLCSKFDRGDSGACAVWSCIHYSRTKLNVCCIFHNHEEET